MNTGNTGSTDIVLRLPTQVRQLMEQLQNAGFEAFAVGGCVRDSLLGRTPGDWDICTNALPAQMHTLFEGERLILTGEKHGTVTVLRHGEHYEITTYRVDGAYTDHRHPGTVNFVPELRQDLARRDFTVNAMAYAPDTGLVDAFGGRQDLAAKIVRCVGEPAQRFAEDALRILRALRFASQLDFVIAPDTLAAAVALRDSVKAISAERIYTELDKLLAGPAAGRVLSEYGAVLGGALPEVLPCMGCTQPGRWHCYDVWQHTAHAVEALPPDAPDSVRWAVLLHDVAKPGCRTVDADGAAHFPGHNLAGSKMANDILLRLRAPRALREEAVQLIAVHDAALPEQDADILRRMHREGPAFLHKLCLVKKADLAAHKQQPGLCKRTEQTETFLRRMTELEQEGCWQLNRLAITGSDAIKAGLQGPAVGEAMERLLDAVMAGALPNERTALLAALQEWRG